MAIAFVQSKNGTGTTGANSTVSLTSPATVGNLLILSLSRGQNLADTFTGYTGLTSVGVGGTTLTHLQMFYKVATGGEQVVSSATGAQSGGWSLNALEYSGTDTVAPLDIDNAQTNASGTVATPTVTPTASVVRLVVFTTFVKANATFSAEQINASATGVTERLDAGGANSSGQQVSDLFVASTSGTYNGTATASTNAAGAGAIAIFKPLASVAVASGSTLMMMGV